MTISKQTFAAALILLLFLVACAPSSVRAESTDSPALADATRWLASPEFKRFVANPDEIFRRAATEDNYTAESVAKLRAWAIANLPPAIRDYRVTDQKQLAALRERLRPLTTRFPIAAHLEIFLFESESPYLGLAEKTMLCVATSVARDFTDAELRAVVAHELGHLHNYDVLAEALLAHDQAKLRFYELQADALGTLLSVCAGEQADTLSNALAHLCVMQEKCHLLDPALLDNYPTLADRKALCARVAQLLNPNPPLIPR